MPAVAPYFNPRSHKGSDLQLQIIFCEEIHFNPRSHKGSDDKCRIWIKLEDAFQSTLPQGERLMRTILMPRIKWYFNPRSHKGSDPDRITYTSIYQAFQSTLPQGERRGRRVWLVTCCYFNPRSHKGSDQLILLSSPYNNLFQSTLPQGERQQFYTKFHICFISFLPILSPYHISTHSPLPTFNHFLYIFSGANRPEISCLLPFRTKTISGIL